MIQEWDIKPLAKVCTGCSEPFRDRQEYYTRLSDREGRYDRSDFCAACWARIGAAEPGYSSWNSVFRVPPAEPDRKVKKETTESLLRQLMEAGDPARADLVYILAVMLERQRVLVEHRVEDAGDGARCVLYAHRKTGELFVIPDPGIGDERLEEVQREVMALLAPDAPPRPGPAAVASETVPVPGPAPAPTPVAADAAGS